MSAALNIAPYCLKRTIPSTTTQFEPRSLRHALGFSSSRSVNSCAQESVSGVPFGHRAITAAVFAAHLKVCGKIQFQLKLPSLGSEKVALRSSQAARHLAHHCAAKTLMLLYDLTPQFC